MRSVFDERACGMTAAIVVKRTQQELCDALSARFGEDPKRWAFICPSCSDIATGADFRAALDEAGRPDEFASQHLGQVCIGRIIGVLLREQPKGGYKGRGCDWCAFGLFRGPEFVVMPDGREVPSFAIAPAPEPPGALVTAPKRIQLRRTKGWRKPEGAVVVSRPSRSGNPYRVGGWVRIMGGVIAPVPLPHYGEHGFVVLSLWVVEQCPDAATAVEWFRARCAEFAYEDEDAYEAWLFSLAGHDLACWCPLPEPGQPDICHAAVLLELANGARS